MTDIISKSGNLATALASSAMGGGGSGNTVILKQRFPATVLFLNLTEEYLI